MIPPATHVQGQANAPYVGYPGPVGTLDGGPPAWGEDAGLAHAGDGGLVPPSTAMPAARPVYPPDAGAATRR